MSDMSTAGASSAGAAASTPATTSQTPAGSTAKPGAPASKPGSQSSTSSTQDLGNKGVETSTTAPDDTHEEVDLGGKKYKVEKDLAKNLKQWEKAAQARFQKAAQAEKQAVAVARMAKDNPEEFLRRTGIDPDQWSEARLAQRLQQAAMSPEQRRAMELEQENQSLKKTQKERDDQVQAEQMTRLETQEKQKLDTELADAWKESGLPNDIFYVKQIAANMRDSLMMVERGMLERPLTAKEAASIVKERYYDSTPRVMSKMDPEGILKLIGEENYNRLRDWDVKRVTGQHSEPAKNSGTNSRPGKSPASTRHSNDKPTMNEAEFREYFASLKGE